MSVFRVALALCLLLPQALVAQAPVLRVGENLIVDLPPGFRHGNTVTAQNGTTEEYLPGGQNLQAWRELITLQRFPGRAGQPPENFVAAMRDGARQVCPGARWNDIEIRPNGVYPGAVLALTCPASPRTGGVETFIAYAISGREQMYVVQYAWTRMPTAAELDAARIWLASATLCDTTRADAPCPDG